MISRHLIFYVLKAAFKDRLLLSYIIFVLLSLSLSVFLGSAAIVEQDQFSIVFLGGALRLLTVFILSLFTVFFVRSAFDTKDIEFMLTRPVTRQQLVVSYALSLSLIAMILSLIMGAGLFVFAGSFDVGGLLLWVFSVAAEAIIIVNAALFFSFVISSAVNSLMALFGLYILGRLIGQILGIIQSGLSPTAADGPLSFVMNVVSVLTPRFDLMGQTSLLVYNDAVIGYGYILVHCLLFSLLFVIAALFDFHRRQF